MIHDPELTSRGIITSDQYSEHVDLMPTLSALALDVTIPSCASISASLDVELCTEGVSLVPLMKDPSVPVKNGSFSQYPRPFSGQPATSAWVSAHWLPTQWLLTKTSNAWYRCAAHGPLAMPCCQLHNGLHGKYGKRYLRGSRT
eukprot:COSAG01_NODE_749_length_13846_cov_205.366097_5_plen_144_part_00